MHIRLHVMVKRASVCVCEDRSAVRWEEEENSKYLNRGE